MPAVARVAIGIVAAAAAVAAGVVVGTVTDDDRDEAAVLPADSTTAAAGAPSTTTTAAPAASGEPLPAGFYVILASAGEASDEAGGLAGVAAGTEGARVTRTSLYTSLPSGDARIGQPPFFLPAAGVEVVALGPFPVALAQQTCATQFDGDCLVRQLTTAPLLEPAPGGLVPGGPEGFDWPHPDHPAFPFPGPGEVAGGVDDEEDCGDDGEDDIAAGCLATYRFRMELDDTAVTVEDVVAFLERFAPATGWTASDPPNPTTTDRGATAALTYLHSCGGGCHAVVEIQVLEPDRNHGPRLEVLLSFDDH